MQLTEATPDEPAPQEAARAMEDPEMEQLEDLIRRCIESGLIEDCLKEEGPYMISAVFLSYC